MEIFQSQINCNFSLSFSANQNVKSQTFCSLLTILVLYLMIISRSFLSQKNFLWYNFQIFGKSSMRKKCDRFETNSKFPEIESIKEGRQCSKKDE